MTKLENRPRGSLIRHVTILPSRRLSLSPGKVQPCFNPLTTDESTMSGQAEVTKLNLHHLLEN